jgi:methionyl-tRNA formyltransferase
VLESRGADAQGRRGCAPGHGRSPRASEEGSIVACGEGRVEVVRAQLEGKKALGAAELVGGRALAQGMVLGERAAESDGPPA